MCHSSVTGFLGQDCSVSEQKKKEDVAKKLQMKGGNMFFYNLLSSINYDSPVNFKEKFTFLVS